MKIEELVDALRSLAGVVILLAVASLRNWNGWAFELDASAATLRGHRIRGLMVLVAALMLGAGTTLQPGHASAARWALLAASAVCGVAFGSYRPRVRAHPGNGRHSTGAMVLEPRSRRTWVLLFAASALLAAVACVPNPSP